jgi:hypothetical protein
MELQVEKLKELAKNETAEYLFIALALKERVHSETDLVRFRRALVAQGVKVEQEAFMDTFRKLEKLGAGSIIYGRNGKNTRFKWNYSLKKVAMAALEGAPLGAKMRQFKAQAEKAKAPQPKAPMPLTTRIIIPLQTQVLALSTEELKGLKEALDRVAI